MRGQSVMWHCDGMGRNKRGTVCHGHKDHIIVSMPVAQHKTNDRKDTLCPCQKTIFNVAAESFDGHYPDFSFNQRSPQKTLIDFRS